MEVKTPIILLSGFLGSGKTTLLLRLLLEARSRGLKPGILMNELGRQDVDGILLNEETGFTVEKLLDGCVCCSKKEELGHSLLTLLETRPDLILVELTGVANPVEIIGLITKAPFADQLAVLHSITVLDAEHALDYASRFSADKLLVQTLHQQVEAADLILVNKTDLVYGATLSKVIKRVRKLNTAAVLHMTQHAELDTGRMFESISPRPLAKGSDAALPLELESPQVISKAASQGQPAGIQVSTSLRRVKTAQQPIAANNQDESKLVDRHQNKNKHLNQVTSSSGKAAPAPGSFSAVQTFTLSGERNVSINKNKLELYLTGLPGQIMRAKGYVWLEDTGITLVQYAGGRFSYEPSRYPGTGYLVVIGLGIDPVHAAEQWALLFSNSRAEAELPH